MTEQAVMFERVRGHRRVRITPKKLADKCAILSGWLRANKPDVRVMRISGDDAWSLREAWKANEAEPRSQGFHVSDSGEMSFRGFDLLETA